MQRRQWMLLTAFCVAGVTLSAEPASPAVDVNDPDRQRAFALYKEHKMPEAAALFEKLIAKYPADAVAHETLGIALLSRADTQPDADKARADRLGARRELLRAKELGDNSDVCRTLLAEIPESGEAAQLSTKPEVDAALKAGEAAFAKGNWAEAIAAYTRAWDLDQDWDAALYLGDTYFSTQDMDRAGEWFAKAIAANPDREQAYRYWGDALLKQGKMTESRLKYMEGIVAQPYKVSSSSGIHNWLTKNNLALKKIPITLPSGPVRDKNGKTTISVDAAQLDDPNATVAWMAYSLMRSQWRDGQFAKNFPDAKAYRHSLAEEIEALGAALLVYRKSASDKGAHRDASLELLSKLSQDKLLEPFVLLTHADEGIAVDYAPYRDSHRDRLIAFLDQYLVPPAP